MVNKLFELEVQSCVKVTVNAKNKEEARLKLVDDNFYYSTPLLEDVVIGDALEVDGGRDNGD